MTSEDDIQGLVSLKFLRPCPHPILCPAGNWAMINPNCVWLGNLYDPCHLGGTSSAPSRPSPIFNYGVGRLGGKRKMVSAPLWLKSRFSVTSVKLFISFFLTQLLFLSQTSSIISPLLLFCSNFLFVFSFCDLMPFLFLHFPFPYLYLLSYLVIPSS
jgi:hypothetical protein